MMFTTHAMAGAAIGILSGNPILGFGLGVLSHHALDALPHFDVGSLYLEKGKGPSWAGVKYEEKSKFKVRRDWIMLFVDVLICGIIFLYLLFRLPINYWPLLIIGALGGLLTDIFDVSPFWKDKFRNTRLGKVWHKWHYLLHWPLPWRMWHIGIGIQVVVIAVSLFLIRKFLI